MYYFTERVESPCPVIKGGIKIIEKSGNSKSGEQIPEGGGTLLKLWCLKQLSMLKKTGVEC